MTKWNGWIGAGLGLAVTVLLATGLQGQSDREGWYPFLGCWAPEAEEGPSLCVRPTVDGVEISRIAEGTVVSRDTWTTRAEGIRSEQEGCEGVHHAVFSDDGNRVFLSSTYRCEGGNERRESGVLSLPRAGQLLDVRSVDLDVDEPVAWVQRFVAAPATVGQEAGIADLPVPSMALETARRVASAPLDIDDVVEATDHLGPGALEAWVAETGDPFPLDGDVLVRLADRGVPAEVIDLMIAVSYPERFAIAVDDRGVSAEAVSARGVASRPYGHAPGCALGYGWVDPLLYNPYGGCGIGYRYSRYSYGPYGYAPAWYGYYNPRVIVVPPGVAPQHPNARAVRGRGYTRGESAPTVGAPATRSQGGTATSGSGDRGTTEPVRRARPRGSGGGGGGGGGAELMQ